MNLKEIKKKAYEAIVKNQQSHQSFYDENCDAVQISKVEFAEEVARIPSKAKMKKHQIWVYSYVVLLVFILLIRLLSVGLLFEEGISPGLLVLLILAGFIVPIVGVVGALTSRVELYKTVALLLGISVFRSLINIMSAGKSFDFLGIIPSVLVVILALYIPTLLLTNFKKSSNFIEDEGQKKKVVTIVFETPEMSNSNILDTDL
jgi:hypothetical protein